MAELGSAFGKIRIKYHGPIFLLPKNFKWQWRVECEYCPDGEWVVWNWDFNTRSEARRFRAQMDDATCFRNWVMKRRRVQRQWETYGKLRGWTDKDAL